MFTAIGSDWSTGFTKRTPSGGRRGTSTGVWGETARTSQHVLRLAVEISPFHSSMGQIDSEAKENNCNDRAGVGLVRSTVQRDLESARRLGESEDHANHGGVRCSAEQTRYSCEGNCWLARAIGTISRQELLCKIPEQMRAAHL